MSRRLVSSGLNRRDLYAFAREHNCRVQHVRRTGEVRLSHPLVPESVLVNNRRKDASRQATTFVRKVVKAENSPDRTA